MTGFTTIARLLMLTVAVTLPGLATGKESEKEVNGTLDTATIAREIGKAGESQGEVYKISLPRTDLRVMVEGVLLKPGLALGSWIAFKAVGEGAVAHGRNTRPTRLCVCGALFVRASPHRNRTPHLRHAGSGCSRLVWFRDARRSGYGARLG